jgi:hypothetical protein
MLFLRPHWIKKIVGPYFLFLETLKLNAPKIAQKEKTPFTNASSISFSIHPRVDTIVVGKVTTPRCTSCNFYFCPHILFLHIYYNVAQLLALHTYISLKMSMLASQTSYSVYPCPRICIYLRRSSLIFLPYIRVCYNIHALCSYSITYTRNCVCM